MIEECNGVSKIFLRATEKVLANEIIKQRVGINRMKVFKPDAAVHTKMLLLIYTCTSR